MPSYLVVFHANLDPNHGPVDIGDDPCFDPPPTWGICRPPTRRSVRVGTNLFFIGYVAPDQYFVKGWFEVGEKSLMSRHTTDFQAERTLSYRYSQPLNPLQQ